MQRAPAKFALLHHTGGGNLGDQASVDAVIGNIRQRWPSSVMALLSMNPSETAKIHGIPSYPLRTDTWKLGNVSAPAEASGANKFQFVLWLRTTGTPAIRLPRAIWRELAFWVAALRIIRHFGLLIVSGGGQLSGRSGPWGFPYSILMWFLMAKFAGVRCTFLNVGAGPLTDPLTKFFVTHTLNAAEYVSFRDKPSQALARNVGFAGKSQVFPDNVYNSKYPRLVLSVCANGISPSSASHLWLILDRPISSTAEEKAIYDDVIAKFAMFASSLARLSYSLALFGTDIGDDPATIEDLRTVLRDRHNIDTPPYDPRERACSINGQRQPHEICFVGFVPPSAVLP